MRKFSNFTHTKCRKICTSRWLHSFVLVFILRPSASWLHDANHGGCVCVHAIFDRLGRIEATKLVFFQFYTVLYARPPSLPPSHKIIWIYVCWFVSNLYKLIVLNNRWNKKRKHIYMYLAPSIWKKRNHRRRRREITKRTKNNNVSRQWIVVSGKIWFIPCFFAVSWRILFLRFSILNTYFLFFIYRFVMEARNESAPPNFIHVLGVGSVANVQIFESIRIAQCVHHVIIAKTRNFRCVI